MSGSSLTPADSKTDEATSRIRRDQVSVSARLAIQQLLRFKETTITKEMVQEGFVVVKKINLEGNVVRERTS